MKSDTPVIYLIKENNNIKINLSMSKKFLLSVLFLLILTSGIVIG